MGNKTAYKEERQTEKKKNEQERKIKIDKKKRESKFWLVPINKKQKRCLSMFDSLENYHFFCCKTNF